MAFFKKKTQEAQQPEEKRDTVAQKSEIPDAVKKALDETLPTLEGNLEKFEELYPNPAALAEDIKEATTDNLLVLADYFFHYSDENKTELNNAAIFKGASSVFYNKIQNYLKDAPEVYVIMDNCLDTPIPYSADGEALIFFDSERAAQWCSFLNGSHKKPLTVAKVNNADITKMLATVTVWGIEFVRFHPEINSLHIKLADMFKCEVKTVSSSRVRFLMLNFIQVSNAGKEDRKQLAYNAMLTSIAADQFLAAGKEDKENFSFITISGTDGKVWIPLFTDAMEYQLFLSKFEQIKAGFEGAALKVAKFSALKPIFQNKSGIDGVVVNPADTGVRIQGDLILKMIEAVENAKSEN